MELKLIFKSRNVYRLDTYANRLRQDTSGLVTMVGVTYPDSILVIIEPETKWTDLYRILGLPGDTSAENDGRTTTNVYKIIIDDTNSKPLLPNPFDEDKAVTKIANKIISFFTP